jgi:PAS domain S-box-containing protein
MALRKSEERLRLALDGSQDGMWDWDAITGQNLVDERWCSMLGYTKAEIVEDFAQWQSLVHPEDLPGITDAHHECMAGQVSHFGGEFRMRTKTGDWKWILGRGAVVERDGAGRPLRLTGTHKDISQQKATELALKNALQEAEAGRDKINAILRSISDALIVTDSRGGIILMNQEAERLSSNPFQTVVGKDAGLLFDSPLFQARLSALLAGEEVAPVEDLELFHPAFQEVRVFQLRLFSVLSQEKERAGVVAILQDVTKSREMDRMKNEFISTAAHELRTPLSVILGFAELMLLEQDFSEDQKQEFLQTIVQKAEALTRLVNELLDLSRMESGGMIALNPTRCSVNEVLLPLVDQYRRIYPVHRFEAELPEDRLDLWIDSGKIGQVLENLLSNAVKYSPAGGSVHLSVGFDGDMCRVTLVDQGIGMTPQQVAKVFDKFYRADFTNTAIGGLGLGMAISRNIVEAHGGTIWVESEVGKGTAVTFTLPRHG